MAHFDWIPYFQGKYLTYYQWFAVLGCSGSLVLSFISFFMYLLICKITPHSHFGLKPGLLSRSTADLLKQWFFDLGFFFLSVIPLILTALDVIWVISGIIGMMAVFALGIYLDNGRKKAQAQEEQIFESIVESHRETNSCSEPLQMTDFSVEQIMRQRRGPSPWLKYLNQCLSLDKASYKKLKICAVVSIVLPLFMYRTCVCFYNQQISYYNYYLGFGINTCFTRFLQLKESCPKGAPCHMYATVPENPESAFFLNIHTHDSYGEVTVFYQQLLTDNITEFKNVSAQLFEYHGLEPIARRNVHTALITGLKSNTQYLTKVFYDNQFWTNAIYKTLPSSLDNVPIKMINAGDSGNTEAAVNLSKMISGFKPDIFFMGGDIAYDDNMPACAYTWDYFLDMYENICSELGYMMPIVSTVGNHDVGLNELPGVNITVNNHGPAYHIYFPQHYHRNLDNRVVQAVPPIQHRRTFLNYTFGNVHYLALDSGYMHGFDGYQKKFLIESLETNKDKVKFVNYHVPIYSVCQNFDRNPERFLYALFHWVPNFDKYKVMCAFQNHVHSFKRTKPLRGSSPAENGTVYLGDGAYGAIPQEMCTPDVTVDIFDSYAKKNNFWLSEIGKQKVQHWAYDSQGVLLDYFEQQISGYKLSQREIQESPTVNKHEISMEEAEQFVAEYYKKQEGEQIPESLNILNQ